MHLLPNLLRLARLLRRLGMAVGTSQVSDLASALTQVDIARRDDVYHAARCILTHSREEQDLFDRAFDLFWAASHEWAILRDGRSPAQAPRLGEERAASEAQEGKVLEETGETPDVAPECVDETQIDATYSRLEALHAKDFACYSEEELRLARRVIESLVWRLSEHPTRRRAPAAKRSVYLDLARTIQGSLRNDGEMVDLAWQRRKRKTRPLTVICDISGSMDRYSRLFLHFIYTLAAWSRKEGRAQRVEAFVFGTRLTRITQAMRHRDVDGALDDVSGLVQDWSGGTRIGESLRTFNYTWSRRALGRGAVAIVISDGWDRGDLDLLEAEVARLQRSVHRLIWLNPLLGAPGYEPLALGMRAVLPHVHDFLPLHNLASLEALALELGQSVRLRA